MYVMKERCAGIETTSSHVPASRYFQPYERTLRRGSFGAYKLVHGMLVWVRERERASKRDRERERKRERQTEREREREIEKERKREREREMTHPRMT